MAEALRRAPWQVQCLVGGYEDKTGPELYWLDYLGTLSRSMIAAQGYATHFVLSILDNNFKKVGQSSSQDMSQEEAFDVMKLCFAELKNRFLVSQASFIIKVVSKDGIQVKTVEL